MVDHCLYLQCHDSLKQQNDGLVNVAEGLYYRNNVEGNQCVCVTR